MTMEVNYAGGKIKAIIGGIILVIVLAIILSASIQIVDAGHRGVLLHWQEVDGIIFDNDLNEWVALRPPLNEGLHFVVPIQDEVVNVEIRTQKYEKQTSSASKDLQIVSTGVTLNYHPAPESVHVLYRTLGLDYAARVIQPAVDETVKQVTANYNAEELITKRPQVKADIEENLRQRLLDFNIVQDVVSITDFEFSTQFSSAIEAKVQAEQDALREENLVKLKTAQAKQLEQEALGDKLANIQRAEGDKAAAILRAEGLAEAIKIEAEAEKEKIRLISEFIKNNPEYLQWYHVLNWNGKLPDTLVTTNGDQGVVPLLQIPNQVTQEISITSP